MSNVYYLPLSEGHDIHEAQEKSVRLLHALEEREGIKLESKIPLKVHFGEQMNKTFLPAEIYGGLIDDLQGRGIECCFMETSVLYGGQRFNREKHLKLAEAHGFTRIPAVIADGANGEDACEVRIDRKHFKTASIAKLLAESNQTLVLSHFKGHMLAGFGGAIKQLSMGFAAKGGKMAMHMGVKPRIVNLLCKKCKLCMKRCNANAITIGKKSYIDHDKCIGCGACFSICPHHAVSIFSLAGFWNAMFGGRIFREKLVEYAYASHHGKQNVYITFAMNITAGCDCEPRPMRACIGDIGIFASLDPVSIDAACYDAAAKAGKRFRGAEQLDYAEKIGLGRKAYQLIEL